MVDQDKLNRIRQRMREIVGEEAADLSTDKELAAAAANKVYSDERMNDDFEIVLSGLKDIVANGAEGIPPVLHVFGFKDGEPSAAMILIADMPGSNEGRCKILRAAGDRLAKDKVLLPFFAVLVTEAWMLEVAKDDDYKATIAEWAGRFDENPERIEVICVHGMAVDKRQVHVTVRIGHDADNNIVILGEERLGVEESRNIENTLLQAFFVGCRNGFIVAEPEIASDLGMRPTSDFRDEILDRLFGLQDVTSIRRQMRKNVN